MNDEQMIEYLRSRGRAVPPPTLTQAVMVAVESAPPRRSWFAAFIPAIAVVAVAGALLMLAVLIGQRPVGPTPVGSEQPTPSATEAPSASPTPSPSASQLSLVQPGAAIDIPAVDATGQWGTIHIERGEDLGGYADALVEPGLFVIEFFVSYTADRMPDPAQFGSSDWALQPTDPNTEFFFHVGPVSFERFDGLGSRPDSGLVIYPGAVDIFTTPTEGTIAFAVGARDANLALELLYRPGTREEVAIAARNPGPPPDPVPRAGAPQYVAVEGAPFTVLENAEADALFSRPDECVNPDANYSVTFPDDWYTNTETGDVAACSWFTPQFFAVTAPGVAPDDIWISIQVVDGMVGYTGLTEIYLNDQLEVDGRPAARVEYNADARADPDHRGYQYVILLGENGPTLVAATSTDRADNYLLAKAVLDRIMASFAFED